MAARCLFLYGSLLHDTGNAEVDGVAGRCLLPVARAAMRGRLYDIQGYPAAVAPADDGDWVYGYVYRISPARWLPCIDRFEDYQPARPERGAYRRTTTDICIIPERRWARAWVYYYNHAPRYHPRIRCGDYLWYAQCRQAPPYGAWRPLRPLIGECLDTRNRLPRQRD